MPERPEPPERAGPSSDRRRVSSGAARKLLRNPVPAVFLLAGLFDLLSGDFLVHGLVLFAVAAALIWDTVGDRIRRVPAEQQVATDRPGPVTVAARAMPRPNALLVVAGVLYAVLAGSFARYSWPASIAVFSVAAAAIWISWRTPSSTAPRTPPVSRGGALAWTSVFVALALWELAALLLQPALTISSSAHPTISVLMDSVLRTPVGRSAFLAIWLAVGWELLER